MEETFVIWVVADAMVSTYFLLTRQHAATTYGVENFLLIAVVVHLYNIIRQASLKNIVFIPSLRSTFKIIKHYIRLNA